MKNYNRLLLAALIGLLSYAGVSAQTPALQTPTVQTPASQPSAAQATAYQQEIDTWHSRRIRDLKAPNGWLNLAGLYWLDEGASSFGAGPQNKIIFPAGTIDEQAGTFQRTGSTVRLIVQNATIKVDGKVVKEAVIFDKDSARQPVISSGHLRWTIIQRGEKIGIRLRDLESPLVTQFKDIDRFPVDTTWRIQAVLQPQHQTPTIAVTNILGQTNQQPSPGKLVFTVGTKQYTLDALEEGDELFIIFGDETSGKTTYPSGRFLAVKKPGADGLTTIDFNFAYNPPCAFTGYATCPLPPPQNILPFAVTAGEKNYGHYTTQ
jgi:uncharacterized protein (DUF1684 family)